MKTLIIATAIATLAATGAHAAPAAKAPFVPESTVQTVSDRGHGHWRPGRGDFRHRFLSPRDVSRVLYRKGYRKVHDVRFTRGVYVAKAIGYRGLVRLVIDPRDGDVLRRERIGRNGYGHGYGHGHTWRSGNTDFSITFGIR